MTFPFKTKIRHELIWVKGKPYYKCNRAVGVLSGQQVLLKTDCNNKGKQLSLKGKKLMATSTIVWRVTCKNCLRWKNDL